MSINSFTAGAILALAGTVSLASAVSAQDVPVFGVADISCRELLTMGGDEQDATLIFMNGYVSGQGNEEMIDPSAFMAASDATIANCIDTPDEPLVTVLKAARGG